MSMSPPDRRSVLKLMAASMALGGLPGCDPAAPDGHLFPDVIAPPGVVPGRPDFYATATLSGGRALGVVVEHVMGRPIKVEGNELHPTSRGATDALAQAAILDFYDPDRAGAIRHDSVPASRPALLAALAEARDQLTPGHGDGLRIVTPPLASPSMVRVIHDILAIWPGARWHQHEPAGRAATRAGVRLAYGRDLDIVTDLSKADVVLALQSDLLDGAPGHVRHGRDFAARRNPAKGPMNRLYAAESTPSLTGAAADHRFVVAASGMHAVAAGLTAQGAGPGWLAPVLADLQAHRGRALIHAGPGLPPWMHAQVLAANEALGARGGPMRLIDPVAPAGEDMAALLDDLAAGRVTHLVVLDTNPVLTEPGFRALLARASFTLSCTPILDETAQACRWFVPQAHPFETWGDLRADDGTATVLQPQALPLHNGIRPLALLSLLATGEAPAPMDAVRTTWRDRLDSDAAWHDTLASGVIPGTEAASVQPTLRDVAVPPPTPSPLTLVIRQDPYLGDGRHANNAWLQELPRPLTKTVWDNPLLVAPALAARLGLVDGDEVEVGAAKIALPILAVPGQAEDCVVAHLGFGRTVGGRVGVNVGVDAAPLLAETAPPTLRPTGRRLRIASTDHVDKRLIPAERVREAVHLGTLAEFQANPAFLRDPPPEPGLYHVTPPAPVAWGMSIDLNACIGCNACVVACTAENNVPVVGRDAVLAGREMHWLRIDRYWHGPDPAVDALFQPVLCMHCEQAPCEVVCPVGATTHDEEGLNVMTYNRCVGTRFCSNNCPYKVRRFNFAAYAVQESRPPIARNPDVRVRARGVMEKCTFCVQRIAAARIEHDRDGVPERAVTACQAACPTRAFSFGDLNDPGSEVRRRKGSPLDYALFPDQRTRPRVTYEARIRNPNPALPA